MGFQMFPIEQQGHYRYDPTSLSQQGPARIFPYAGEEGTLYYILTKLQQNLIDRGKLSQPLTLVLQQVEQGIKTLDETWAQLSTLLVDLEVFQSGWFNLTLPPDEQFGAAFVRERREMATALMAAKRAASQSKSDSLTSPAERISQQRERFYQGLEAHGQARPLVSLIHQRDGGLSDREFARQRLAGQNPMVIRRVQPADQVLLGAWANNSYSLSDGRAIDLTQAAQAHRLFLADYPLLADLTPTDLQPGRYVGSPIAVFYRTEAGLEPLLIQVEPGRVLTPAAGDDWTRAKLYVQAADVTHHELIAHLADTHLAMEAFAIATPRQLPASHPVYRLLRPHFQYLLAINTRGNTILLGEGAAIDQLMAPTRATSLGLINKAYRQRAFSDYALPVNIQNRGLEPEFLPELAYRDDALLLWEAIAGYGTQYLHRYYQDDEAVQQDPYLQAWAAELGAPLASRPQQEFAQAPVWLPQDLKAQVGLDLEQLPTYARVPDFPSPHTPGSLSSLHQLIQIVTQVIFTCGPQHAAVNFSQFDYVGYTPNAPLALYSRPDTPVDLETLLPNAEQELAQMQLTFALSGIRWGSLGSSDLIQFIDPGDRQALSQFQAELAAIEAKINTRNQQRLAKDGIDYPYLLPSRIPNSINI